MPKTQHRLVICSLRDLAATCDCGWIFSTPTSDCETSQELRNKAYEHFAEHLSNLETLHSKREVPRD